VSFLAISASTKVARLKVIHPRMAPNLAESQHAAIRDMGYSKLFKANEIAEVAGCNPRSIYKINKTFAALAPRCLYPSS
jgi:hypothetical protein